MQIKHLTIENVYALRHVDLDFPAPVTLVAGPNAAGKSSLADALRLALTGDAVRVKHKKDLGEAVHDGAKIGTVTVTGEGWQTAVSVPSGKSAVTGTAPAGLDSALFPAHFSGLGTDERRAFLIRALGVQTDAQAISAKLEARGHDMTLVAQVAPQFGRLAWDLIAKQCAEHATKAKGAWEQIAGEKWGAKKAETWAPTLPLAPKEGTLNGLRIDLSKARERYEAAVKAHAGLAEQKRAAEERDAGMRRYQERAEKLEHAEAALKTAQEDAEPMRARVERLRAAADAGTSCACPECGAVLRFRNGALSSSQPEQHDDGDLKASAEALAMLVRAIQNHTRDRDDALEAAKVLNELRQSISPAPADADIEAAKAALDEARDLVRSIEAEERLFEAHEQALKAADSSLEKAAKLHKTITGWLALAEALGPGGLPGEAVREALGEFNGRLAMTSEWAGWPVVTIREDMEILCGGRRYGLCSESEKWRADALIAEALSFWSSRLLVLDRADVLSPKNRIKLLTLLHRLATVNQLGTVLVLMTAKEPPAGLPKTIAPYWIENGEVRALVQQREEVAT